MPSRSASSRRKAGWTAFGELGLGYDSNITGVPSDFFAASQQSIGIGFNPVGNSLKRSAWFGRAAAGAEYFRPIQRGWSVFVGGEARGRAYHKETISTRRRSRRTSAAR
jgi:hypothetical protein